MVKGPVPLFVSVTACAELVVVSNWPPNVRLVGLSATPGAAFEPVPLRLTLKICDVVIPPSVTMTVIASVADSAAPLEGVKVTLTVQEAPAAMPVPQVL